MTCQKHNPKELPGGKKVCKDCGIILHDPPKKPEDVKASNGDLSEAICIDASLFDKHNLHIVWRGYAAGEEHIEFSIADRSVLVKVHSLLKGLEKLINWNSKQRIVIKIDEG